MPKNPKTKRNEYHLMPDYVEDLNKIAKENNKPSRKNYVESVLINIVNEWRAKKKAKK